MATQEGDKSQVEEKSKYQLIPLAELLQDQSIEIDSIYRAFNYIEKLPETQRQGPILENRSKHLYMLWSECTLRHHRIHLSATPEEKRSRSYFTKRCYETLEEKYLQVTDQISLWMTHDNSNQQAAHQLQIPERPTQNDSNVKLPRINIPTFSGKFTDWAAFSDAFKSLIKGRNPLSNLEKLHYLKASVQGDAHELICNVPLIATNFETAWTLLETRYLNTRATVNAHLKEIFSLDQIKKESASQLLNLRNVVNRNLSALKNLGRPTESYSDILINRIVTNLDANTQRDWELHLSCNTDCPTFDDFDKFLLERIRALEALNHFDTANKSHQNRPSQSQAKSSSQKPKALTANSYIVTYSKSQCPICEQDHKIYKCQKLENMSVLDRYNNIKSHKLCINCLAPNHKVQDCSSEFTCRKCKQKHHTMLHRDLPAKSITQDNSEGEKGSTSNKDQTECKLVQTHFLSTNKVVAKTVLLATVKLQVTSNSNRKVRVRALLDQGSTWSFISDQLATALNAKRTRVTATLSGLSGTSVGTSSSAVEVSLMPIHTETPVFQIQDLVLPKITSYVPDKRIPLERLPHIANLPLADDPSSDEEIQMLIGADIYAALISDDIKRGKVNEPIAQKSVFGWVLSGPITSNVLHNDLHVSVHHGVTLNKLDSSIKKFWETEDISTDQPSSPDEEFCESHFASTHTRLPDGRYMVRIPFKESPPQVGQSRFIAERSLHRIESRLAKNPSHRDLYTQFMTEYET